ncbi:MAG: radical SAM family heme chaperone HemW [bacterium]|nr:radical SAM family heme chaperone HemW [bacterium]
MEKQGEQLEVYIHVPFCVKKCEYCDFLSFPASEELRRQYVAKLCEEVRAAENHGECVGTVFFGGGTPSLFTPKQIQSILDSVRAVWRLAEDVEISMEMNPGTLGYGEAERERLAGYREAGINRLSIGLQSANNEELQLLGRIHTWEQFLESYRCARELGFANINVDLMSALPKQSRETWEHSLRKTAELAPEHISAYSLIIEEGTPFYEKYHGAGEGELPDEDTEREMYARTEEILQEYGYERYEISNYAKEGKVCRHNVGYWTGVPYLGFGLGAASYYQGQRFSNTRDLREYLAADFSDKKHSIRREVQTLSTEEKMEEFLFLGLRLMQGVRAAEFRERFGWDLEDIYGKQLRQFEKWGLLEGTKEGAYRFTREGISVSNSVLCEFLDPQIPDKKDG